MPSNNNKHVGFVQKSTSQLIVVEIADIKSDNPSTGGIIESAKRIFEQNKSDMQIGDYLKIAQGNRDFVIATILNISATESAKDNESIGWRFLIECQPIGTLSEEGKFSRGGTLLPVPLELVYILDKEIVHKIFSENSEYNFTLGRLATSNTVEVKLNGDKFFSKHIAVVGSTGSGKSCTVTKILHEVIGITTNGENKHKSEQKNAHILIFDVHSEYAAAFSLKDDQLFTRNFLSVDNISLPYWLMNSEELEAMFIESNEANSHNQISQFKNAVTLNKKKHNPDVATSLTYDTPVYFSMKEVYNYIDNLNREVIGKLQGEGVPKLADGTLVKDRSEYYFDQVQTFTETSTAKETKASNGPFNGQFDRFLLRLETRLADKRLEFLFSRKKEDGTDYKTDDLSDVLQQYLGYLTKSNVTIIDLSGIPFEVMSVTISLIARLVFDFCFHHTKVCHSQNKSNEIPVMIVCEEAHNYVPNDDGASYRPSRKSIERIAKEGRKYGLSLMIVSQRPSEVSETIFAQCSNFVAMRLTNSNDQVYVKRLLPDNLSSVTDTLPNLGDGECIVIGDAIVLPSVVKMDMPSPEPKSQSVKFHEEWLKRWQDVTFDDTLKRWRKY